MRDDGWGDRGGDRVGRGAVVVVGCGRGHGVEDYYLVALSELVGGVLLVWVGERERERGGGGEGGDLDLCCL